MAINYILDYISIKKEEFDSMLCKDLVKSYKYYCLNLEQRSDFENIPNNCLNFNYPKKTRFDNIKERINILHYINFLSISLIPVVDRTISENEFFKLIINSKEYLNQIIYYRKLVNKKLLYINSSYHSKSFEDIRNKVKHIVNNKTFNISHKPKKQNKFLHTFNFKFSNHAKTERLLERNIPLVILYKYLKTFSKYAIDKNLIFKKNEYYFLYAPEIEVTIIFTLLGRNQIINKNSKNSKISIISNFNIVTIINRENDGVFIKEYKDIFIYRDKPEVILRISNKRNREEIYKYFVYKEVNQGIALKDKFNLFSERKKNIYY